MMTPVLATRLRVPRLRASYIIRNHLMAQLEKVEFSRLTVIQGGAGSGKTTLMASYIAGLPDDAFRWISLDRQCSQLLVFWSYVFESLSSYLGESQEAFMSYFYNQTNSHNLSETLITLVNSLPGDRHLYLILDDYHLIHDESVHQSLDTFIEYLPANVHLILLTREYPQLYLARYEMEGTLLYIREDSLALDEDESLAFLRQTLKLPYSQDTLIQISRKAEGWIGGLQLISSALSGKDEQTIRTMDFNSRFVKDYLTREVFSVLSSDEQDFLMHTCIPSYFNQSICRAVKPEYNFSQMMQRLADKNMLIICLDEGESVYRYHHILKDYLLERFHQYPDSQQQALYKQTAAAFLESGDYNEGLYLLYTANDLDAVIDQLLARSQQPDVYAYFEKVPLEKAMENIDFLYQKFFYHYSQHDVESCMAIYQSVQPRIRPGSPYSLFAGTKLLFSLDPAVPDFTINTAGEMEKFQLLPMTKALVHVKNAAFLHMADRFIEALEHLDASMALAGELPNTYLFFYINSLRVQVYEELGYFKKSLAYYDQVTRLLDTHEMLKPLYISQFISVTGVYLKQMELEKAKEALDTALYYANAEQERMMMSHDYNLAEYYWLCGRVNKAAEIILRLSEADIYENITWTARLLKCLWRSHLLPETLATRFIEDYETDGTYHTYNSDLLYYQICFDRGDAGGPLDKLDQMLSVFREQRIYLKLVETALLKIQILIRTGGSEQVILNLYQEAIHYACADRIRQPFYYEAESIMKMQIQFGGRIAQMFEGHERAFHQDIVKMCRPQGEHILSEREMEVLSALAAGLSNKEIAEDLCISLATVKTHIINIYKKLAVNSRVNAVEIGRQLGLL